MDLKDRIKQAFKDVRQLLDALPLLPHAPDIQERIKQDVQTKLQEIYDQYGSDRFVVGRDAIFDNDIENFNYQPVLNFNVESKLSVRIINT